MRRGSIEQIILPYAFDTSGVWRTILKGAVGLNALLIVSVIYSLLASRPSMTVLGLALVELIIFLFSWVLVRFQEGSVGILISDRVVVEPTILFGLILPGPRGVYPLDRFSGIRVEFRAGPVEPGVQGGPNEVVWLVGKPGTPNVAIARADDGAGRAAGREFGKILGMPVAEVGAPKVFRL